MLEGLGAIVAVSESESESESVNGVCQVAMLLVSRLWLRRAALGLGRGREGLEGARCRLGGQGHRWRLRRGGGRARRGAGGLVFGGCGFGGLDAM